MTQSITGERCPICFHYYIVGESHVCSAPILIPCPSCLTIPDRNSKEPRWACRECGYSREGFTTRENMVHGEPSDYDVICPECGSDETSESAEEALSIVTSKYDTLRAELSILLAEVERLKIKLNVEIPYLRDENARLREAVEWACGFDYYPSRDWEIADFKKELRRRAKEGK